MQCVKLCEKCLPLWCVFVLAVARLRLMLIISIVAIHIIPAAGVRWTAFVAIVIGATAAVAGISWSRITLRSIRLRLCIVLWCIWCLRWMLEWPRWWLLMWICRWQWWLLLIVRWLCGILIVIVIICIIVSVARTIETRHTTDVLLILMCVWFEWSVCVRWGDTHGMKWNWK